MSKMPLEAPGARELSLAVYLRSAVLSQRIYPSGSPIVERAVSHIQSAAETILKTAARLTLTDRQGRLYANGKEEPDAAALAGVFQEQGIQSLMFLPGLTGAEITALVRILGQRRSDGRKFTELLADEKIQHVQADRVTVVEIEDGEVITKKVDDLFKDVTDFTGLVGSLREGYDMIEQVPSIAKREELRGRMAGRMAGLPAHLLKDLFENPLPKKMEEGNLRDDVLKKMTTEKVHDIFSEIGQWYENVRKNASSDFAAVERLTQLKSFLGKMLGSPASRHVPFAIYEELLQKGLIAAIPDDVRRDPTQEPLAAQVDRLMEGPAASLLENPAREKLPALFNKLCAVELFDLTQELLAKFLDNFYQESAVLRQLAVRSGRGLLDILWRCRKPELGEHLYETLRRLADAERSREVYAEIAETIGGAVVRFLVEDRPVKALEAVALLRRHQEDATPFLAGRNDMARQALERASRQAMDVLVEGVLCPDPVRAASARNILYSLGGAAAPCLGEVVKKATDLRTRRSAAMALKEMGEAGARTLAAELTLGLSSPVLLNLLSVAEDFLSLPLVAALKGLQYFPDAFVRARIAQLLGRCAYDEGREMLVKMLEDKDESVQVEAARALGEIKHRPAVPALAKMLQSGGVLRREEACIALGKIADDAIVPPLMETLTARGGIFSGKGMEETVRVRAAWALGNVRTPLGRMSLKKLLEDANPQVRLIARQGMGEE